MQWGGVSRGGGESTLRILDSLLRERASAVLNFTLLVQLRLLEREYEEAFSQFHRVLSDADMLSRAPRTFPLSFARLLTELSSRSFVPRGPGSPQGSGLWQNLRDEVRYTASDHLIGRAFEESVLNLRNNFPELFFRHIKGWRYLSNILTHSGIPVQTVPYLINALYVYIPQGDMWAERIDASRIERALHAQPGLNKYTVSVLTQTTEGVRLVQQFLRLCHFVRNGGVPQTAVFSEPFVEAVQGALRGKVRHTEVVSAKDKQPTFIFDDLEQFIGWVVPMPVSPRSSFVVRRSEKSETIDLEELDTGRMGIRVLPESTILTVRQGKWASSSTTLHFSPRGLMLFDGNTGSMIEPSKGLPKEISSGEYLVLAERLKGVDIEARFRPAGIAQITEEGILLPSGWGRKFQGFRIYFSPTDELKVLVDDEQWTSLRVGRVADRSRGHIMFSGSGATYLHAYHAAVPERRVPVFSGKELPAIHFWGEIFSQSVPEVRLSRWTGREWRIIRHVVADVQFFSDGASVALKGKGVEQLAERMRLDFHVLRLDFHDLSYDPLDVGAMHFIWVPGAIFFSQFGLLPPETEARLSLHLAGDWSAAAAVGTVELKTVPGGVRVFHRLPKGVRRALLKLRCSDKSDSEFTLSWGSLGTAVGTFVASERVAPAAGESPKVGLPLEPISATDLDLTERIDLEWWPVLRAALSLSPSDNVDLGNVIFDRHGRASIYVLPLEHVLRNASEAGNGPGIQLRVGGQKWMLFRLATTQSMGSGVSKQDLPVEQILRLLWEAELIMSDTVGVGFTRRDHQLVQQLRALPTRSPQVRFMLDRLKRLAKQT
jgi:hypothetical protein